MEFKTKEALYLIGLLVTALTEKRPQLPQGDIDFDYLYKLSVQQKVEAMAYIGLSKLDNIPDEVMDRFENEYKKEIAFEMIRHSEGRKILSSLEKTGIDCLPLKGWVIKDMYPMPAMRYMCDIDILFKEENAEKVRDVLQGLGYEAAEYGKNPDVYMKKPILNIEMHKALIQDKTDHFEKTWDRALKKDGCSHTYYMTAEDYYIYMSAHLRKHFFGSGTGVRSVCDIFVFLSRNKDKLDFAYIDEKLKNSGIYDFDMRVRELCDAWFGDGEMTDELYGFGMKFLYGGAFGTKEVNMRNVAAAEISSVEGKSFLHKKIKYILRLIFPSLDVMKEEYPFLKRVPVLLPAAWIMRGFRSVFLKKGTVRNVLSNAARVSEDTAEKRS